MPLISVPVFYRWFSGAVHQGESEKVSDLARWRYLLLKPFSVTGRMLYYSENEEYEEEDLD